MHHLATKLDSTKVTTYLHCPRRFYFEHIHGWRREGVHIDFHFGRCVHHGTDAHANGLPVAEAWERFMTEWRSKVPTDADGAYPVSPPRS